MFFKIYLIFLFSTKFYSTFGLKCVDVEEKGSCSGFSEEELRSLGDLTVEEIEPCLPLLGREPLTRAQSHILWSAVSKIYGGGWELPEEKLRLLGHVLSGIPDPEIRNLSLSQLDTVRVFGNINTLTQEQMSIVTEVVLETWGKDAEELTEYDIASLGHLLCTLNSSFLERIHPHAYRIYCHEGSIRAIHKPWFYLKVYKDCSHPNRGAATELGMLENCGDQVLQALATLASDSKAFGSPSTWTSLQVSYVGCVLSGLPSLHEIPAESFQGLTAQTLRCMPPDILQRLTADQISKLSGETVHSISWNSISSLDSEKQDAVQRAIDGDKPRASADNTFLTSFTISNLSLSIVFLFRLLH